MKMTLSYRYLSANLDLLAGFGFSRDLSLKTLNMTETMFNAGEARLEIDRFLEVLDLAAKTLSSPNIALRLGHKFRVSTFAETGSVYGYCETLEDVIQMNGQYQKLAIDAGEISYVRGDKGEHYMNFAPFFTDVEKYRPIIDIIMGAYGTAYRWLSWGSGEDILDVELPYKQPSRIEDHEAIYQTTILFNAERTCIHFSEAAIQQKLTTRDPEKLRHAKMKLDRLLGAQAACASFDAAVDAAILAAIRNGHVTSHIVADRMNLTWSAFRTHLKTSGFKFRDRLDHVRQDLFRKHYHAGHSFSQIAMALAYNDQPAMNRAFRRWYGMTPTQWGETQEATKLSDTQDVVDT